MASGGPRGNAGRRPDPNAARWELKSDRDGWTILPLAYDGDVPDFPLVNMTEREQEIWDRQWRKPQAIMWARLNLEDEVALFVRYMAEAEVPDASASVRTLVKQHQELLGLSTSGMLRNRWKVAVDEVAAKAAEHAATEPSKPKSSRDRLKAV